VTHRSTRAPLSYLSSDSQVQRDSDIHLPFTLLPHFIGLSDHPTRCECSSCAGRTHVRGAQSTAAGIVADWIINVPEEVLAKGWDRGPELAPMLDWRSVTVTDGGSVKGWAAVCYHWDFNQFIRRNKRERERGLAGAAQLGPL
jgi:hypothetical protein